MYTLFGSQGIGIGSRRSRAHAGRHPVPQRRRGVMGARSRARRTPPRQSAVPDPDTPASRWFGADRKRRHPHPSRPHASRQRIASRGRFGACASHSRPRVHRGQLLRRDRHHRLSRTLVRGPRRGHEQAHQGRDHATTALPVGGFCRHVSRAAIPGGQRLGALDLLAAVVSKWSGSRKHLATARPEFSALLARIEGEPRVAPIFARHWPPAA